MSIREIVFKVGPIEVTRKLKIGRRIARMDVGSDGFFNWQATVVGDSKIETLTTIPDYPGRAGYTGEQITTPGEAVEEEVNDYGPKNFLRYRPDKPGIGTRIKNLFPGFQYYESAGHN